MTDDGRCTGCGSKLPAADGACPYCGTAAGAPAAAPSPPDPAAARAARLRKVRESGVFERLRHHVPSTNDATGRLTTPIVGGVFFVVVAAVILANAGRHGGMFLFMPLAFVAIGIWMVTSSGTKLVRYRRAPTRAYAARIAGRRTHVTSGKNGRTDYFVTLEYESGARQEYEVVGSLYGTVSEDDVGVAHVRDTFLTGFRNVDA